ncbi:MAG: thymidine phosphorylase [Mollicutes bacterium]|nr:thymidine phosphorylase [Mollicutes bacterium]
MDIKKIIEKKQQTLPLNEEEINYVINNYLNNNISDEEMTLFLKVICKYDMNDDETFLLTKAMLNTGYRLDLSQISNNIVDKHSTGGIGDNTTLIILPIMAALGIKMAKMSGRGLGFTGGTADKVESIPGFKVNLTEAEFLNQLKDFGIVLATTNKSLAPADKKIYALRDVTNTVSSIPLIVSSIMSKKLATNSNKIVFDVKVGRGALIKDFNSGLLLASKLVKISKRFGKEAQALITNMDYPLGNKIGNSLEITEALDILSLKKINNLSSVAFILASLLVSLSKEIDYQIAYKMVRECVESGQAYHKFLEFVKYQGGQIDLLKRASFVLEYRAEMNGYLNDIDALKVGEVVRELGAGRKQPTDSIDHTVGLEIVGKLGDHYQQGDVLCYVHTQNQSFDLSVLKSIFLLEQEKKDINPLIYGLVED